MYSLLFAIFMLVVFLVVFEYAIAKDYFRDENQFIASGKLLQSAGLLPYRDYPYFHLPNLVFVYALIDCFTDSLHLGARLFSVVCAWIMLVLLAISAQRWIGVRSWLLQLVVGMSAVLLLLPNPLFRFTTGLAWNHDAPVLLTFLAALVFLKSADSAHPGRLSLAAGFLLGLAVGTRVSFLTAAVAFLTAYLFHPLAGSARSKARLAVLFCAGLVLALIPTLLLFLLAPRQFIFGNLTYAGLNTLYREITDFVGPMTSWGKLFYFNERFLGQPGNVVLVVLWALAALCAFVYLRRQPSIASKFSSCWRCHWPCCWALSYRHRCGTNIFMHRCRFWYWPPYMCSGVWERSVCAGRARGSW